MENEENRYITFGDISNTTLTDLNTYGTTTGTTITDYYYNSEDKPSVTFSFDGEEYDMRSIILLLKVLMNKEGLSEELLTMDYNKLEVILDREIKIDTLLK